MIRLLREPLLHFAVAGGVLFGGYSILKGKDAAPEAVAQRIHVTSGDVTWLAENWTRQWRRPPTQDELRGLVTDYVNEQLLAREARALGLEDNDLVIRRRLAQKLSFIIEDTSRRAEPTDDELQKFYQAHRERFRTEARISFRHVYSSTFCSASIIFFSCWVLCCSHAGCGRSLGL
ncbi:MAG: hypothetical protein RO009_03365 [Pseudorhodoplanes sp.]|jgi:hypothetical protein|nr:hypothetical protein [Pseudorhodoplanes sp.]